MMVGSLVDQELAAWAELGQLLSCLTETESLKELSGVVSVFSNSFEAGKNKKTQSFLFGVGGLFGVFVYFLNSTKFAPDTDRSGKWPRE